MSKIQVFERSFSVLKKSLPKVKINPQELRYIPDKKIGANVDKFISMTSKEIATPVKKEVTVAIQEGFRRYLLGKKLDINITQDEIKKLLSFEGEKFKTSAYELLCEKLKIPVTLKPEIEYSAEGAMRCPMAYNPIYNKIFINPQANFTVKETFLTLLRHELQHYNQNMQMFRSEDVGVKVVKSFSEILTREGLVALEQNVKNASMKELEQLGLDDEALKMYKELKKYLNNGETEKYNNFMSEIKSGIDSCFSGELNAFRDEIISEYGVIKAGTPESKRAAKFLDEWTRTNYFQKDGQIDFGKYLLDCRENEAILAQEMLENRLFAKNGKYCYMEEYNKKIEQFMKNGFGNEKVENDLKKALEEKKQKGISLKEMSLWDLY